MSAEYDAGYESAYEASAREIEDLNLWRDQLQDELDEMQQRSDEFEARLLVIATYVRGRQKAAEESLERMHGGAPFPPVLDADMILRIATGGADT